MIKKYSGKIICIETRFKNFMVGKTYEVKDGKFLSDNHSKWSNDNI